MKIEFTENEWGVWFEIKPETPEEVSELVRYALNASSEKPEVLHDVRQSPTIDCQPSKAQREKAIFD